MLGTVFNSTQMLCAPTLGMLSDRLGRKRIMLLGLLAQSFCNALQSRAGNVVSLLFCRALVGVAMSTGPVETAYIMDDTENEEELKSALALQSVLCNGGALLGPLLVKMFQSAGFAALCQGMALVNLLSMMVGIVFWREDTVAIRQRSTSLSLHRQDSEASDSSLRTPLASPVALPRKYESLQELPSLLDHRAMAALLAVSFFFTFGCGVSDGPEIVFFKQHFGYGPSETCTFLMVTSATSLACGPLLPSIISAMGEVNTCVIGCLGSCAIVLILVAGHGHAWVPCAYGGLSVGLFAGMVGMGYMGLVQRICPRDRLGTVLGLKSFVDGLAGTLAPAIGGFMYAFDNFLPYGLQGAFSLIAAAFVAALLPYQEKVAKDSSIPPVAKPERLVREAEASILVEPLYLSKSLTLQLATNHLRITMDPELHELYTSFRDARLTRTATVAGGDVAAMGRTDSDDATALLQPKGATVPSFAPAETH
eukprot:TRINITY_DN41617_c0_g1_i1.p1 TRINITY_DN41617_c0_g1~~TRINITY_DN41617_c0_g1_i1.p1  ORF type:complete len:532 (+),score=97.73 TRINITY_DN41617_c0_g1_i1:158-1597(+)